MADEENPFAGFKYYYYDPSTVAAIIFIILFALTGFLHVFQMVRTKTWFFLAFVIGGLFEFIGYTGRAVSASESPWDWTLGPYITQSLFLLVAPALFAASIYMTLGRIILLVDGEAHSIIRKKWLTKLFVAGDVLSFLLQGGGGGLMASKSVDSIKMGENLVVAGLFVQLFFFGFFIVTAGIFHIRIARVPTAASLMKDIPWKRHMFTLYAASLLIMIRSIFRVIEYLQGYTGYLLRHEVFLYIFDAVLMFLVMLIFNWCHPSEVKALLRGGKYTKGFFKMEDMAGQLPR